MAVVNSSEISSLLRNSTSPTSTKTTNMAVDMESRAAVVLDCKRDYLAVVSKSWISGVILSAGALNWQARESQGGGEKLRSKNACAILPDEARSCYYCWREGDVAGNVGDELPTSIASCAAKLGARWIPVIRVCPARNPADGDVVDGSGLSWRWIRAAAGDGFERELAMDSSGSGSLIRLLADGSGYRPLTDESGFRARGAGLQGGVDREEIQNSNCF